jgi:hypothetical protein
MNENPHPDGTRRHVLIMIGATDAILGAAIVLIGFGFFPMDPGDYGIPVWVVLLVGGLIFTSGIWMMIYNYSSLDE